MFPADTPTKTPGLRTLVARHQRAAVNISGDVMDNRTVDDVDGRIAAAVTALQDHGAVFAYLHGSRAAGTAGPESDADIAAYFDAEPPEAFEVLLPAGIDLLVLNSAPLELAGRIALHGKLLFERDAGARVRWEATTRKIYLDELPRLRRAHREFAEAVLRRGR